MLTCPKCHAGVPEGMRFCLECGASLAPAPSAAEPEGADPPIPAAPVAAAPPRTAPAPPAPVNRPPALKPSPTVPLKISPTPVMNPRAGTTGDHPRPSLGDPRVEIDDEVLKKAFERPNVQPGAVVCRFCKGPLDINGDFCDVCGAPVAEAAPPGVVIPRPQPAEPPDTLVPPPNDAAQSAPSMPTPAGSSTGQHRRAATPPLAEPTHPTPTPPPAPIAPPLPPTPPANELPSGFVGRLKGLFKKG